MTPEQKKWIDEADYKTLLRKWRFASVGDPMFQDECGKYFSAETFKKGRACIDQAKISKQVGWDK